MIVVCPACQSRYKFDEAKLGDRPKVKTRCAKCGGTIEIENPLLGAATMPPGRARRAAAARPAPAGPRRPPTSLRTRETPVQPATRSPRRARPRSPAATPRAWASSSCPRTSASRSR